MTYKRTHLSTLAGVGTLFLAAASAQAATLYWVGSGSPNYTGSWDTATQNWDTANGSSANSAWVSGDAAQFSNGGTATINANVTAAELVLGANTTLTGNGSYTLTVTGNNPASNGAGKTLTVNGAAVDFSNGFIGGAANLELDSGTITVGGSTAIAPTSNGWSLNVTGGTLNANTVTHGFRLGSNFFNGSTGEAATATQSGGTVEVGGQGLQIGSGSGSTASTTSYTDSYTLSNGTLALASLKFGAVANTTAEFNLSGGTVTVNTNTISFDQGSSVGTSYFNFETGSGMLVLKDSSGSTTPWTFSTLTGIKNSSFLVNGNAATSSELTFAADTNPEFTDISLTPASVPDPATFGLVAIGGLALLVRRRKAFRV